MTELRSRRNDGVPLSAKEYIAKVSAILDVLETPSFAIPLSDQLVGLAYYALTLRNDVALARMWLIEAQNNEIPLDHHAKWLRDQYQWVQIQCNNSE